MNCVFTSTTDERCVCVRCGKKVIAKNCDRTISKCRVRVDCERKTSYVGTIKVECCAGKERDEPVFICQRFGRCLPNYAPLGEHLHKWKLRQPEASLYHLCHGCESFRPVAAAT